MSLKLYMTSVTSSRETKSQQNEIMRILDTRGVEYETVDISQDKCILGEMREKAGNSSAVPPQLFRGDKYIGIISANDRYRSYQPNYLQDHVQFMEAVEDGNLEQFLELQK